MSIKRARLSEDGPRARASKKPKVNVEQVAVWEALADDEEAVRLSAALNCISNYQSTFEDDGKLRLLQRLFRGLCSSRKSARLGFYVALVGVLNKTEEFSSIERIIQLAQHETVPEPETSGQDERDHYFGRLLACKAIIESGVMCHDRKQIQKSFIQLLKMTCELMSSKPWLRNEAMLIICSAISNLNQSKLGSTEKSSIISNAFDILKKEKLARTIDGLGLWLFVRDTLPDSTPPSGIWAQDSPLHSKELSHLKRILLDSRAGADTVDVETLGTAGWVPRLHTVWSWQLTTLSTTQAKDVTSFERFWTEVVDGGLFEPSASPERKYTGFLVLECALFSLPASNIAACFSKNLMATMLQAMRPPKEAYLTNLCNKIFSKLVSNSVKYDQQIIQNVIIGLIKGSEFIDFDTTTKTRTIAELMLRLPVRASDGILPKLLEMASSPSSSGAGASGCKNVLNIMQRAIIQTLHAAKSEQTSEATAIHLERSLANVQAAVGKLLNFPEAEVGEDLSLFAKEKAHQILETMLTAGFVGHQAVLDILKSQKASLPDSDDNIQKLVISCQKLLKKLCSSKNDKDNLGSKKLDATSGMALLLASLLNDAYGGETESIELLTDAEDMATDLVADSSSSKPADHVVDLIISLASRPSKFQRRLAEIVFQAFTPTISLNGLQPIIDIIKTRETKEGQLELFENWDEALEEGTSSATSDEESLGSDVEVLDASEDEEEGGSESNPADESQDEKDESDAGDEDGEDELTAFESALAAALGTRKLTNKDVADESATGSEADGSDSDMSDSDMLELDAKLAEVFKNQLSQASAQKQRKNDMKIAKENMTNLKNRALDLAELYMKTQFARGLECSELSTAILSMAGSTAMQQLSQKGLSIIKAYVAKAKGSRTPQTTSDTSDRVALTTLCSDIHELIALPEISNAVVEAAGQLHLIICKLLIQSGEFDIADLVRRISDSRHSRPEKQRKSVTSFWSRYDAWSESQRLKPGTEEKKSSLGLEAMTSDKSTRASKPKSDRRSKKRKT